MSLFAQLAAATKPVVSKILADLGGSTITVKRERTGGARNPDGSKAKRYDAIAGGTGLACALQEITLARSTHAWGGRHVTQAEAYVPLGEVDVQDDDGVIVTAGERAGAKFRVNQVKRYPA